MSFFIVNNGRITTVNSQGASYNGDKIPGENANWDTFSTDPNEFIKETYGELSKRNTTLYHTFAPARAVVNKPLDYIIGDGLYFKSEIDNELLGMGKKEAVLWSKRFSQLLHYAKKDTGYYGKQKTLCRQACITGDSILYILREDDGRPFDLIVSGGYDINWEKSDTNVTLGIKTDNYSRPIGFYKNDGKFVSFKDDNGFLNAILFMFPETAGQLRGNGCFYSEIARAKGFDRVWDSTLARMVMESVIMGYFANDEMDGARQLRKQALRAKGVTSNDTTTVEQIASSTKLNPGGMLQFNSQGSMKFNDLKTPSKNFGDANEYYLSLFSMARGYPKAFITGQYDASYSAGRSVLNDAMKRVRPERKTFIDMVDTPINLEYLKYFASNGLIPVPDQFWTSRVVQQMMVEGIHIGPEPEAINPLQEAMADKKNVDEGFLTREVVARKKGIDYANTNDDWKQQNEQHLAGSPAALLKEFEAGLIAKDTTNEDN